MLPRDLKDAFHAHIGHLAGGGVNDVVGDIVTERRQRQGPEEDTEIGQALTRVLGEIDEIAAATLKSITLATLLKTMGWHEQRLTTAGDTGDAAGEAQDAGPAA